MNEEIKKLIRPAVTATAKTKASMLAVFTIEGMRGVMTDRLARATLNIRAAITEYCDAQAEAIKLTIQEEDYGEFKDLF